MEIVMYSRNLGKGAVRASSSYTLPKYNELTSTPADENRYRYNIPPGYDGSRFSRRELAEDEMDMKRHTASSVETVSTPEPAEEKAAEPEFSDTDADTDADIGTEDIPDETEPDEAKNTFSEQTSETRNLPKEYRTAGNLSGTLETVSSFVSMLKDRISGDDLLLIVIILMLAIDGEDAEITILLLTLLLLVK